MFIFHPREVYSVNIHTKPEGVVSIFVLFTEYGQNNCRMAKTTKWLNAILDYMKKVKSSISMVFGLVF